MKVGLKGYKAALVTLVAIASLVVCLAFTVVRLFEIERDLRTDGMYSNIWFVTQAQFEAAIFAESLARKAAGEDPLPEDQSPAFRADMLISRLVVLLEGEQGKILKETGLQGELKQAYHQLTLAAPRLQGVMTPERRASAGADA